MDVSNSPNIKQPSESAAATAKAIASIVGVLQWIVITLCGVFVMSIPLVTFTPLGQVEIAGKSLASIASSLAHDAVIAALLFALVLVPVASLCRKVVLNRTASEGIIIALARLIDTGTNTPEEVDAVCHDASFTQRVCGARFNCTAISGLLSAVIGYLCYVFLLNSMHAPWAHLLTLIIIFVVHLALNAVLFSIVSAKYKREDPEAFYASMRIASGIK